MWITMRGNHALLDRFDYLNELIGSDQKRTNLLRTACKITLDKLRDDPELFSKAMKLKVKSYERDSVPVNIKIDIDDELFGQIRKSIKEHFHLERVQNPFACKLVLSVYIMSLIETTNGNGNTIFTSDLDRIEIFTQMLKRDRKYVGQIDQYLSKWITENGSRGGNENGPESI